MNRVIRTLLTAGLSLAGRIMQAYSARVATAGGVTEATACATSALVSLDRQFLLQSATFVLIPSGYKAAVLYAELPQNGNGDFVIARTSTATRVNSSGTVEAIAANVPQIDYSLGSCPVLLLEPIRQNMALNSAVGATQSITVVSGRVYTLSFYGTGSITYSGAASGTLNGTGANNRVSVTITAATTTITLTVSGTVTLLQYEGTAGSNPASYATSYIPTTGAAVTRTSTNFTRSNIYTNNLISSAGGTWFLEFKNNISIQRDAIRMFHIGDSSDPFGVGANAIAFNGNTPGRLVLFKSIAGVTANIYTTAADNVKLAIKWDGTNINVFANGVKVVTNSVFATTLMENLLANINARVCIAQMALWNTPLSDAQCVSLTS